MLCAPLFRCFAVVAALWALAVAGGAAFAQAENQVESYVAGISDLPLMPGLNALPDSGVVFDKPGGRIVEAFAEGSATPQSVIAFYDETLPQLGWRREAPGAYLREGERLQLAFSQEAGKVTVHFRLFPQ
jgi:hypothetical protein